MNRAIREFAAGRRSCFVLDFQRLIRWQGYRTLCDDKSLVSRSDQYTDSGFKALAEDLQSITLAARGGVKKVLVLDLDNTLWGGVLGEDGPSGIQLSEDGIGKGYRDFQKCIKAVKSIGIILAINSKNNESDIEEFFERSSMSSMMLLKYGDFAARRVNWNSKVDNIVEIAAELDLGTDSIVFIDDSPTERALVRQYLSEVAVPEFPSDPTALKSWFLREVVYRYFPRVRLTEEESEIQAVRAQHSA